MGLGRPSNKKDNENDEIDTKRPRTMEISKME